MQRNFPFAVDEFYHLYNRGTEKRTIFKSAADYTRFMHILYLCNGRIAVNFRELEEQDIFGIERGETLIDIGAYCLMPNHFHILVHEKEEDGISLFMRKLLTAYSMYFNKKNGRTGSLFDGAFKAKHAHTDNHLQYLFSYIHLNPAKIVDANWKTNMNVNQRKIFDYISRYPYSSFPDWRGKHRKEDVILQKNAFPNYFEKKRDAERSLIEWLNYSHTKDLPLLQR